MLMPLVFGGIPLCYNVACDLYFNSTILCAHLYSVTLHCLPVTGICHRHTHTPRQHTVTNPSAEKIHRTVIFFSFHFFSVALWLTLGRNHSVSAPNLLGLRVCLSITFDTFGYVCAWVLFLFHNRIHSGFAKLLVLVLRFFFQSSAEWKKRTFFAKSFKCG